MSEIKLLAFDMDNTLLNPDKKLTARTIATLKQLNDNGQKIVLTTGRPYTNVQPFLQQLSLNAVDDHVILFNGGLIYNVNTKGALYNNSFTKQDVLPIYHLLRQLDLSIDLVTPNHIYAIKDLKISSYVDYIRGLVPYSTITFDDIPQDMAFNKFVVNTSESNIASLQSTLKNNSSIFFDHIRSRRTLLEFVPQQVSKANALTKLLQHLNMSPRNLMAFGDEENDLSMLQLAHIGVAMDNAIPSVKHAATVVTLSNAEDGVADYLEKYFEL